MGFLTPLAAGPRAVFPPEVALHVGRLACERPALVGRSLSAWDCTDLARQLMTAGSVEAISAATGRRMLAAHQLKPWRQHAWLDPKPPREAACYSTVSALIALDTRPLRPEEVVLSVEEKTSLPPRPRRARTRHEHESKRAGALHLLAAFDTRSGPVYGHCEARKRPRAWITFLEALEAQIDAHIHTIHLVCDHVRTHQGKEVRPWVAKHPRFGVQFTPVHGSWMNHVEQWCSLLQRQRLRLVAFDSHDHLRAKLEQFVRAWNQQAHPFNGSTTSVAKVMAAASAIAA